MSLRNALLLLAGLGALLALNVADDWQYLHDDNGRRFTSYARSHLSLGLQQTRGWDFFYDQRCAALHYYGHHPPGPGLLLAGWFWIWESDSPLAARSLAIVFHLLSASLVFRLLHQYYPGRPGLTAGVAFVLVPMSSFFGKMVGYEPFLLPFLLACVMFYWHWAEGKSHWWLALSLLLAITGVCIDWTILFALLAMGGGAVRRFWRGGGRRYGIGSGVIFATGLAAFVVMGTWLMSGPNGSQGLISAATFRLQLPDEYSWWKWTKQEVEYYRRYLTEPLLVASLAMTGHAVWERSKHQDWSPRLRLLLLFGVIGLLPVIIFPNGARYHAYWQFYCLPYAVLSLAYVLEGAESRLHAGQQRLLYAGVIAWLVVASAITLWSRYTQPSGYVAKTLSQWQFFL